MKLCLFTYVLQIILTKIMIEGNININKSAKVDKGV